MKKILYVLVLFTLASLFILPAVLGLSASLGTARAIINANVVPGKVTTIDRTLTVNNVNNISVNLSIEALGDLRNITRMIDKNVVLGPGESKDIAFQVEIRQPKQYEGSLAIAFYPSDITNGKGGVGLDSRLIIFGVGPENGEYLSEPTEAIDPYVTGASAPYQEEIPSEETTTLPPTSTESNDSKGQTGIKTGIKIENENGSVDQTTPQENKSSGKKGPNPLIGLGIIVIILLIGLAIFIPLYRRAD